MAEGHRNSVIEYDSVSCRMYPQVVGRSGVAHLAKIDGVDIIFKVDGTSGEIGDMAIFPRDNIRGFRSWKRAVVSP